MMGEIEATEVKRLTMSHDKMPSSTMVDFVEPDLLSEGGKGAWDNNK